jgi:hypothetical protein
MLRLVVLVDFESFFGLELKFFDKTFPAGVADLLPTLSELFLALKGLSAFFEDVV